MNSYASRIMSGTAVVAAPTSDKERLRLLRQIKQNIPELKKAQIRTNDGQIMLTSLDATQLLKALAALGWSKKSKLGPKSYVVMHADQTWPLYIDVLTKGTRLEPAVTDNYNTGAMDRLYTGKLKSILKGTKRIWGGTEFKTARGTSVAGYIEKNIDATVALTIEQINANLVKEGFKPLKNVVPGKLLISKSEGWVFSFLVDMEGERAVIDANMNFGVRERGRL